MLPSLRWLLTFLTSPFFVRDDCWNQLLAGKGSAYVWRTSVVVGGFTIPVVEGLGWWVISLSGGK